MEPKKRILTPRYTVEQINEKKPSHSMLTALYYTDTPSKRDGRYVMCLCSCGTYKEIEAAKVVTGNTRSCCCSYGQKLKGVSTKYNGVNHHIYRCHRSMMERCYDPRAKAYKNYGAKGVIVCEEWRTNYQNFLDWALANGWSKGLQLDKDIKGDGMLYSPETCCFVTPKVNSNHRRSNIIVEHNGQEMRLTDACELLKLTPEMTSLVKRRMYHGWVFKDAITRPYGIDRNGTQRASRWSR